MKRRPIMDLQANLQAKDLYNQEDMFTEAVHKSMMMYQAQ